MVRKSWRMWVLVVVAAVMVCMMMGSATIAEDSGETQIILLEEAETIQNVSMDVDTEKSAELFVDRAMKGTRLRGVTLKGASLTGGSRNLYDRLRADIIAVANGAEGCDGSTIFSYSVEEIYPQTSFSAADLNVSSVKELSNTYVNENGVTVNVYTMSADAYAAIQQKRTEMLDFNETMDCLQQDCSYELYWYDKTADGTSIMGAGNAAGSGAYGLNDDMTRAEIKGYVTVKLVVSQDYAVKTSIDEHSYSINPYKVDIASYGAAVATAAANAQSIVSAHENESNYQRLLSYKNAICTETDYNHKAANKDNNTPYGNPWQLVWVFDGNPDTKVVCEGYSKAFKYLNDLSGNNEVDVILAEGIMGGGTGEGRHMWNIVRMEDGANYLADITNCDDSADGTTMSVGYPDKLFLKAPASGNVENGYTFSCDNSSVTYRFDGSNYGTDRITLAPYGYLDRPQETPVITRTMDYYFGVNNSEYQDGNIYGFDSAFDFSAPGIGPEGLGNSQPIWTPEYVSGPDCFTLALPGPTDTGRRVLMPNGKPMTNNTTDEYNISCDNAEQQSTWNVIIHMLDGSGLPKKTKLSYAEYNMTTGTMTGEWQVLGSQIETEPGKTYKIRCEVDGTLPAGMEFSAGFHDANHTETGNKLQIIRPGDNSQHAAQLSVNEALVTVPAEGEFELGIDIGFGANNLQSNWLVEVESWSTNTPVFAEPDISVEICDDSYDSVLVSLPWVDGATTHNISIYTTDGTFVYGSNWEQGNMQADECMFQINIVQGEENRLMNPGEYYAEITLKGDGYRTTRFRRNFIVAGTGYSFNGFAIPSGTTTIETEAFAGISAKMIKIPAVCTSIGSKAFDGSGMKAVYIPGTTITIANDALPEGTLVYAPRGSAAAGWAATNGYEVVFTNKEPK